MRCKYAIPVATPSATDQKKLRGVGRFSACRTSPPSQYSSTRQYVGGAAAAPRQRTMFGWRRRVSAATSARQPAMPATPEHATLTATATPSHAAR